MTSLQAIQQLARILGRHELAQRLGLGQGPLPAFLTAQQRAALQAQAEEHIDDLVRAMLEEAAACDDVIDGASALAYLDDRLSFLGDLLTEEQKERVRQGFGAYASKWG